MHNRSTRLKEEYEEIANKALKTPNSTEQLMELREYVNNVRTKEITLLEERVIQARQRVMFLVSHTSLSKTELRLNTDMFNWYTRMPTVFEEHDQIMQQSRTDAENSLKVHV